MGQTYLPILWYVGGEQPARGLKSIICAHFYRANLDRMRANLFLETVSDKILRDYLTLKESDF